MIRNRWVERGGITYRIGVVSLGNELSGISREMAGDTAIGQVSMALQSLEDETRTFCYRIGGDEFLLVRIECDAAYLQSAGNQIQEYLRRSRTEKITACEIALGYALQEPGMRFEKLQKLADQRMYETKKIMKQKKLTDETEVQDYVHS